jgi:competence protein ComEC
MRFIGIIAFLLIFMMLFGCGGQNPPVNTGNGTSPVTVNNETNNTSVKIIINQQKNQTTQEENNTLPTTPEEPKKDLDYEYEPNATTGIYFIYVGGPGLHGDAILIRKGNFNMLVDAGPAENAAKVVNFLHARSVDKIQVLVSTTADPRRYGGMNAVADEFQIDQFWWQGQTYDDQAYASIVARMGTSAKKTIVAQDGYTADINGINFTILNPAADKRTGSLLNDAIVMRADDRNFSILFTSDIQTGGQGSLISGKPALIKTKVLEAPYYGVGSGTAQIGMFLNTAKPEAIVISGSADESPANGGSRDPFRRLMNMSQYQIRWYENYVNGTIRVMTDGQTYSIQSIGS